MPSSASESNELLELITRYNNDLWPIPVVTYATGIAAVLWPFARQRPAAEERSPVLFSTFAP